MEYEDKIMQQMCIAGLVLRSINKLLSNTRHTDKYIHGKCREFSEAGMEACGKIDKYLEKVREGARECS